jgi:hypothetical protein
MREKEGLCCRAWRRVCLLVEGLEQVAWTYAFERGEGRGTKSGKNLTNGRELIVGA